MREVVGLIVAAFIIVGVFVLFSFFVFPRIMLVTYLFLSVSPPLVFFDAQPPDTAKYIVGLLCVFFKL